MKLLLEFKDYNDLSFVRDTIEDSILSEIEEIESIKPIVYQSVITISDSEITCLDLKRSENNSGNIDFKSYLISLNQKIKKEDFDNISPRIESTLSLEFDEKIKCIALKSFPIDEFVICNEDEYNILQSIYDFEDSIEDVICNMENNPYTSSIELTSDGFVNFKSITIWIRKYLSKFGVNLRLDREKIESNYLNYKINPIFLFNSARDLPNRWIQDLDLDKPEGFRKSDLDIKNWIKINLHPVYWNVFDELKIIEKKINSINLEFKLDLNSDPNYEAEMLLNIIREKVFPIFETQETKRISDLYEEFRKLEEYGIDAEWTHEGNYFYLFDINFKGEHYIINIKYDIKKDLIKIHMLHPNDLSEEINIEDFCNTIYLLLEEN